MVKLQQLCLNVNQDYHVLAETMKPIDEYDGERTDLGNDFVEQALEDQEIGRFLTNDIYFKENPHH